MLRGTKEGVWGPHPGAEPRWESGGEAPRSWRQMLNIRLNIAIDRHKSRTVQSPIIDYFEKMSSYDGGNMHPCPLSPLGHAIASLHCAVWIDFQYLEPCQLLNIFQTFFPRSSWSPRSWCYSAYCVHLERRSSHISSMIVVVAVK